MDPAKGYYALIQYCPNPSRLEAVNVGVFLFLPEQKLIRSRFAQRNDGIKKLFGKEQDWIRIEALKTAIRTRLEEQIFENREALERFIETRANAIQITPLRFIKIFDVEKDLDRLFSELVEAPSKPQQRIQASVRKELARLFEQENLTWLQKDFRIEIPAFHRVVHAPFAFRNGHVNLIQPEKFLPTQYEKTACLLAVEGHSLYHQAHSAYGQLQLMVVGEFSKLDDAGRRIVRDILEGRDVKLYGFEDVPRLIQEIRETAKPMSPIWEGLSGADLNMDEA